MSRRVEIRRDIAEVEEALRRWDPIGVLPGPGDDQGPMDEYDSYAPHVLGLLQRGADVDLIEGELVRIRSDMGLGAYPVGDRLIAEDLVKWWASRGRA